MTYVYKYIIESYSFLYHLTYVRINICVHTVGIHPTNSWASFGLGIKFPETI